MGLITHLAKACFVQGLSNERIQTIVRSKGKTALLSTCIDAALEEELAILSARERRFSVHNSYGNMFKGPPPVSIHANNGGNSSREQVLRGSGRRPGFVARVEAEGLLHPGRGMNVSSSGSDNRGVIRRKGMRDTGKRIRCYACGDFGRVARACTVTNGSGWKRMSSGNEPRFCESSHAGPRQ
jgi:hypothetical protein